MSTAALEWSRACTGKQAPSRENRTPGARGSPTPGSNKTANGNASPARAHLFSRTYISEDLAPLDGESDSVSTAEAEGGDAALEIAAMQFVERVTRMRAPLAYPCPACGNIVGARFNFCPNCKCNLYRSCPQCKREVAETDEFCLYSVFELDRGLVRVAATQQAR